MTIRALARQKLDRFGSAQWTLGGLTRRAVEWFADDTGDVFGVIADHGSDLDWSRAVLAREHAGRFRALALDFGFRDANDARRPPFAKMAIAVAARDDGCSPLPAA